MTPVRPTFVPIANSPTRSLFSSVCVYSQKSSRRRALSERASTSRLPSISIVSGESFRLP